MINFSRALDALKQGEKITREGWNGKNMFLYYVPEGNYMAHTGVAKKWFGEDSLVPYTHYIAIKAADGLVSPWVASQTDLLSLDWKII